MSGESAITELRPAASWTDDCQGKKDYDGPLLSISTRYWPGPEGGGAMTFDSRTGKVGSWPYGPTPSAHASILLRLAGGEHLVWRDAKFEALTTAEVKALVEAWVREQLAAVIELLGGLAAFKEDWR